MLPLSLIPPRLLETQGSETYSEAIEATSSSIPESHQPLVFIVKCSLATLSGGSSYDSSVQALGIINSCLNFGFGGQASSEELLVDLGVSDIVILVENFVIIEDIEPMAAK